MCAAMVSAAADCWDGEPTGALDQSNHVPAEMLFDNPVALPVVFVDAPSILNVAPLRLLHPVPGEVQPPRSWKVKPTLEDCDAAVNPETATTVKAYPAARLASDSGDTPGALPPGAS